MRLTDDQTVIVETLGDIKAAIQEFLVPGESVTVEGTIKSGGKTWQVEAPAECDYKTMLKEGFEIVKTRLEAKERNTGQSELGIDPISVDGHMWLDDLITRRLGGVRDGLRVRWDLAEGTFFFDPFTSKLVKSTDG